MRQVLHLHPLAHAGRHGKIFAERYQVALAVELPLLGAKQHDAVENAAFDAAVVTALEDTEHDGLAIRPRIALYARDEVLDLVVQGRNRDFGPQHEVAVPDAQRRALIMLHYRPQLIAIPFLVLGNARLHDTRAQWLSVGFGPVDRRQNAADKPWRDNDDNAGDATARGRSHGCGDDCAGHQRHHE